MRPLLKTTVVIWHDPKNNLSRLELSALAREAESGTAFCSMQETKLVTDPEGDKDWGCAGFFDTGEEDKPALKPKSGKQ